MTHMKCGHDDPDYACIPRIHHENDKAIYCSQVEEILKLRAELVTADIREHDLRIELARYKAVADAASAARDAFEAYGDDPNPETGKAHILATIKLSKALLALAALDAKPGQEGG